MKSSRSKFLKTKQVGKIKSFPISKLFPNIVTVAAICFGLSSIRFALDAKWEVAVSLIIISGILDIIDGRLARFLKATSNFGAQIDSLADFVNFGVAPSLILYLWALRDLTFKGLGWAVVLFFSICCAVRLARFNTELNKNTPAWQGNFFTGVPSTIGGYLAMIPIMLSFQFNINFSFLPEFLGIYMVVIGVLMVSKIPTFATKKLEISREYISLILVCFALVVSGIIIEPWYILPIFGLIYIVLIPVSYFKYKKLLSLDLK